MKKNTLIVFFALLPIFALLLIQVFYWGPSWRKIMDRCTDYKSEWLGMLDCYGVISIWQRDNSAGYLIQNNLHPGPIIAQIKDSDSFFVQGNEIYFINITPKGVCNNLAPGKYCGVFQVNGETENYYYDTPEEVPTLIVTNIKTGDQRFYAKLSDIPADERNIFITLTER